jgi:hypothetical protein
MVVNTAKKPSLIIQNIDITEDEYAERLVQHFGNICQPMSK